MEELLLQIVVAGGSAVVAGVKAFKFVQEGELGIKLRFGRAMLDEEGEPKVIPPGFVLLIPFIETLRRRHVRQQTLRLANQRIMISDGLIFNISAVVIFRVKDVYRALFEIDDLDQSLSDLSMGVLRDVLSGKSHTELYDLDVIAAELLEQLREKAEEWGVEFNQFKLTDCAPTNETALLVNARAAVRMRVEALESVRDRIEDFDGLSPTLAAALVGVPLTTSVTAERVSSRSAAKAKKKG